MGFEDIYLFDFMRRKAYCALPCYTSSCPYRFPLDVIADLDQTTDITQTLVSEAMSYRQFDCLLKASNANKLAT